MYVHEDIKKSSKKHGAEEAIKIYPDDAFMAIYNDWVGVLFVNRKRLELMLIQ